MKIHEESRAVFATYAGMNTPDLPGDLYSALQVRLARWQNTNFRSATAAQCALGIGEEIGELLEALTDPEKFDAVGDCLVFACQLATLYRLDFGTLVRAAPCPRWGSMTELAITAGRINHVVLKTDQGIRGFDDPDKAREWVADGITGLYSAIESYVRPLNPITAWIEVAEQVLDRNWVENPESGLV